MEPVKVFALQNFEYSRLKEILFFTEWDDALQDADYNEPAEGPDFNYSLISEFEADEAVLDDIRMTDTEALTDLLNRSSIIKKHYFI